MNHEDNMNCHLVCPYCYGSLQVEGRNLVCYTCKKPYPIVNSIPNFCEQEEYWCNISKEKMQILNVKAHESGDWLESAKEVIPEYLPHIEPFSRADVQFMWPVTKEARILDAGSMWGGVTIPVAQYCKEIIAVDKTIETLSFLKIRAEQMGFKNIFPVGAPLDKLPFKENYFDLVILNGVLEWVGFKQDLVLETHWNGKRRDRSFYLKSPRIMQMEVLKELHRVLKTDGYLYFAIENRIGYQYLTGVPDDHVNIKFVSLLPRFLANTITKWKRGCEYRTYTYTKFGYGNLLKKSGFKNTRFWGVFHHYINPDKVIPFELMRRFKNTITHEGGKRINFFFRPLPSYIIKHFCPSILMITQKSTGNTTKNPRIIDLLIKSGVSDNSVSDNFEAIIASARQSNHLTANYIIYDKKERKQVYFCKICRNRNHIDVLKDEAENLKTVNELLQSSKIEKSIPRLLYYGTVENITMLVTNFMEGEKLRVKRISKKNLGSLDRGIQSGIRFLAEFQQFTERTRVEISSFLIPIINKQRNLLKNSGLINRHIELGMDNLIEQLKNLKGTEISLCAIHGDYDFYNLLFMESNIAIVDFEHFELEGLPFFDLANLIFNVILINIKKSKENLSFSYAIEKYNLKYYFRKWLSLYSELSGIKPGVLSLIGPIAALEQKTKRYPYYRDPFSYPMYDDNFFRDLISLRIEL